MDQVGQEVLGWGTQLAGRALSDRSQPKMCLREELREKAGEMEIGGGPGMNEWQSEAEGAEPRGDGERCGMGEVSAFRTRSSHVLLCLCHRCFSEEPAWGVAERVAIQERCCVCGALGTSGSALASPFTSLILLYRLWKVKRERRTLVHVKYRLTCSRQN